MSASTRMRRSVVDRQIGGVCGGIAEYFDWDPTMVRIGYVLLSFFSVGFPGFPGFLVYLILWAVIPEREYY